MKKAVRSGMIAASGAVAVLALAACQSPKSNAGTAPSPAPSSAAASPSASASASGRAGNGQGAGTGERTGSGRPSTTANTGTGAPKIVYFKLTKQPKCGPNGQGSVPAEISWKVTGATGIALSVDHPDKVGSYGNYEAEGSMEFPFSCGGQRTETHTYRITTRGGNGPAATSPVLTATATVPLNS
ncbi:hypothetical protein Val02_13410 [Virgisporangium aliadipatigenens]|uniref:Lipoprotein n=1 Tax=Virgisporangium aliadipatigenens TaxID=741659 RepID=A0A8J4DN37_9ACTN|nr:hypothetical protein [Virgisporangium aliadipatigenens]GIJ44455.1 hypothetical protein Val02_13410 [Virgisporangium aliadipatigenens]